MDDQIFARVLSKVSLKKDLMILDCDQNKESSVERSFSVIVRDKETGEIRQTYSYKQVTMTLEEYRVLTNTEKTVLM